MEIFNCALCIKDINNLGASYKDLWLDLSELCAEKHIVNVKEDNGLKYELFLLEQFGYIVTRETPDVVQIYLKGRNMLDGDLMYCTQGKAHHDL